MRCRRAGVTLIEMMVVIAIIAILVGLMVPAVQRTREAASRLQCLNNLKQLGLALPSYHDGHGCFPPGLICSGSNVSDAEATGFTLILPYIEQDNVYRNYHFEQPWFDKVNYAAVGMGVRLFFCPS